MKKRLLLTVLMICILSVCVFASCNNDVPETKINTDKYSLKNGGFESGNLDGWEVLSGNAFSDNGITDEIFDNVYDGTVKYDKDGKYLYGRYNEGATGKMVSSAFEIGGSGYISFKLGGGKNIGLTYISVIDAETRKELYRFGNTRFNSTDYTVDKDNYREANLVGYFADLSAIKGRMVKILAVDNSTANWGFMTMDSFITYY